MDRLSAIQVFAQVVESGSFAKAAERLGLSTSATSRHVAELEAHLQTRLLNRTTRRVSLTESGRAFYERSVQLLADLQEAEQEASSAAVVPRGTIRLTTSVNFGVRHVAPAIAAFLGAYRDVRFDVSLADRVVDLVEEGFDLAIRIGTPGADNLVARKLGETRLVPCASSAYLERHGSPKTPEELATHNCFTYEYVSPRNLWRFRDRSGAERSVRVSGTLHSNNGDLLAEVAASGAGIVFEPAFIVGPDVRAGRLVPCASSAYLERHGSPKTPEELATHNCLTYEYVSPRNLWRFRDRSGAERSVRVSGTLHSNNGDLLAEVAASGAGIVFEPAFIVGPDVRAGRLVPLLQDFEPLPVPIFAVYPSRKHLSAKVRRFVEFLTERFANAQDWNAA